MPVFRACIAGILTEGVQFVVVDLPDARWHDCACQAWSEAERRCLASESLVDLPCGVEVEMVAYLEPADRMFPNRQAVALRLESFHPADINLDGEVSRWDWAGWLGDRFDWNRDWVVSVEDDVQLFAALVPVCP